MSHTPALSRMEARRLELAAALQRLRENPRVSRVIVSVAYDACPAGAAVQGNYLKNAVPELPVEGCSHPISCTCYYQPVLNDIFP